MESAGPGFGPRLRSVRRGRAMPTGDEYRSRANECIAAADHAIEPGRKVGLLEFAQRWLRLAFQVEQIGNRQGLRGDVLLDDEKPGQRNR